MKTAEVEPKLTVDSGERREACSPENRRLLKDGRTDECGAANASRSDECAAGGEVCMWLGSGSRPEMWVAEQPELHRRVLQLSCLPDFRIINAPLQFSLFHPRFLERRMISFVFDDKST
jgi:hypothetical protein